VLAALNHPNIAAIYGLEENAIVMELRRAVKAAGTALARIGTVPAARRDSAPAHYARPAIDAGAILATLLKSAVPLPPATAAFASPRRQIPHTWRAFLFQYCQTGCGHSPFSCGVERGTFAALPCPLAPSLEVRTFPLLSSQAPGIACWGDSHRTIPVNVSKELIARQLHSTTPVLQCTILRISGLACEALTGPTTRKGYFAMKKPIPFLQRKSGCL